MLIFSDLFYTIWGSKLFPSFYMNYIETTKKIIREELNSNIDKILDRLFSRSVLVYTDCIEKEKKEVIRDILQQYFPERVSQLRGLVEDDK